MDKNERLCVPLSLIKLNSETTKNDILNFKQFVLPVYLELAVRRGKDGMCIRKISNLLTYGCGYDDNENAYRRKYYDGVKHALKFLQDNNYIGDAIDEKTGEIVDVTGARPKADLIFDMRNLENFTKHKFVLLPVDDYLVIKNIRQESAQLFWKYLVVYSYIYGFVENPRWNSGFNKYWTFKYDVISKDLGYGFSPNTVGIVFDKLQSLNLIAYDRTYVKPQTERDAPFCIGTTTIIVGGQSEDQVAQRLIAAKKKKKNNYAIKYNEYQKQGKVVDFHSVM